MAGLASGGRQKSERVSGGRLRVMHDDRPALPCRQDRIHARVNEPWMS